MSFSSSIYKSSLLFSLYSQYHTVYVPIYAPMTPMNHKHVRHALPTPCANRPDVAYLVQATPHPPRRTLDRTTDRKPPSPDSSSSSSSSDSTRMRFLPPARIGPTSLMSFRLLPFLPDEPSIVLPTPPPSRLLLLLLVLLPVLELALALALAVL